jgi:hypothetical protein
MSSLLLLVLLDCLFCCSNFDGVSPLEHVKQAVIAVVALSAVADVAVCFDHQ